MQPGGQSGESGKRSNSVFIFSYLRRPIKWQTRLLGDKLVAGFNRVVDFGQGHIMVVGSQHSV